MTSRDGSDLNISSHGADTADVPGSDPCFSFGVASDVQYADISNQMNFSKTCMRYYRNSALVAREAALTWSRDQPCSPSFAVHLGDLIDGFNNRKGKANSETALRDILAEFDKYDGRLHHVIGNHEYYNFTRKELSNSRLNTTRLSVCNSSLDQDDDQSDHDKLEECGCNIPLYYKFNPHPGFCFVVLDTYDVSGIGHTKDCARYTEGMKILCAVNKNEGVMLNSPADLVGLQKRFVLYNGAVGKEQMHWLRGVLQEATQKDQKVFILCHIPLLPESNTYQCLLWNYDEVLQTLHDFGCIVAVLCGHTHSFSKHQDSRGIHHVTLPGIVEVKPGKQAFATVDVYRHQCRVRGYGEIPSFDLEYGKPEKSATDKEGCNAIKNKTEIASGELH